MNANCATRVWALVVLLGVHDACAQDQQIPAEQEAIAAVERLGGYVYRDADQQVEIISLESTEATDADLAVLQAFPKLRNVDLDGTRVTDAGFAHLLKIPSLAEVSLRGTKVTKAAAQRFQQQHPGVYFVELSPGFQPAKLARASVFFVPILFGVLLIYLSRRKRDVLSPRLFFRGMLWGWLIVVGSLLLMIVAVLQAVGIDFHIADIFG